MVSVVRVVVLACFLCVFLYEVNEVRKVESRAVREFDATYRKCQADHQYMHDAPLTCAEAKIEKDRWPSVRAVALVLTVGMRQLTYGLRHVMDSWASLLLVCTVAAVGMFFLCSGMLRRMEHRADFNSQMSHYPAYGPAQSAIMQGYVLQQPGMHGHDVAVLQLPPGTTDEAGGMRNRFSAWMPWKESQGNTLI